MLALCYTYTSILLITVFRGSLPLSLPLAMPLALSPISRSFSDQPSSSNPSVSRCFPPVSPLPCLPPPPSPLPSPPLPSPPLPSPPLSFPSPVSCHVTISTMQLHLYCNILRKRNESFGKRSNSKSLSRTMTPRKTSVLVVL